VSKCRKDLYELKKINAETLCELEDTKVQLKKSAKLIQSLLQKKEEHEQLIETMREQRVSKYCRFRPRGTKSKNLNLKMSEKSIKKIDFAPFGLAEEYIQVSKNKISSSHS
jgi:poly-D-alanine transfer protein DltD